MMSSWKFEKECVRRLAKSGWDIKRAISQGRMINEIIAKTGSHRFIVRCLEDSNSLDGEIINELLTAKQEFMADGVIVISSEDCSFRTTYTANQKNIFVINYKQLGRNSSMQC